MAGGRGTGGDGGTYAEEVDYRAVDTGSKRVHIAVASNALGGFLKVSVTSAAAPRAKIIVPGSAALDFARAMNALAAASRERPFHESADSSAAPADSAAPAATVAERKVGAGGKTVFCDLRENDRGRFVRLSTVRPEGGRNTVTFSSNNLEAIVGAIDSMCTTHADVLAEDGDGHGVVTLTSDDGRRRIAVVRGENALGEFVAISDLNLAGGTSSGGGVGGSGAARARIVLPIELAAALRDTLTRTLS